MTDQYHCDLSIVLHYRGCTFDFIESFLENNVSHLQLNGIEILIILSQRDMVLPTLSYIEQHPFLNWRLLHIVDNDFNLFAYGLQYSRFRRLLFINASYIIKTELIPHFLKLSFYYTASVFVGNNTCDVQEIYRNPYHEKPLIFLLERSILELYLNSSVAKGGIFLNAADLVRALELQGAKTMVIDHAFEARGSNEDEQILLRAIDTEVTAPVCYYDYLKKSNLKNAALTYFETFENYHLPSTDVFKRENNVVALVSIYNEKRHIKDFLTNLSQNCDAIIVLDDGSDDQSYDDIAGEKVILKIRKSRNGFDDLGNRNILLKLSFFFNTKWILFMDADERITNRFESLNDLILKDASDVYAFNFVDLWDSCQYYRKDMLGVNGHNAHGVYQRYRLFKNIGYTQIRLGDDRRLHFPTVPYLNNSDNSEVLIYHLGIMRQKERLRKYAFYKQSDHWITKSSYNYLLDQQTILLHVDDIRRSHLCSN